MRLKDQLEVPASKPRSLVKKFLDDMFLKRLNPYIKFNLSKNEDKKDSKAAATTRAWPESAKDQAIKVMMEEKRRKEEEEQRLKAEEEAKQAELEAQAQAEAAQEVKPSEEEEVKAFKLADKIFDDYGEHLHKVFEFFSAKAKPPANILNGRWDVTIKVNELLDMLRKANLLDGKTTDLELQEVIFMIEKYYDPAQTLKTKLAKDRFDEYIAANPLLLKVN